MRNPNEIEINGRKLSDILADHALWLAGNGGQKANLRLANLTEANLRLANLTDADLTGADLTDADLTGADLTEANLTGADLTGANLRLANLTDADLTGANLTDADLTGANLRLANLTGANLTGANLRLANITDADLTGAKYLNPKKEVIEIKTAMGISGLYKYWCFVCIDAENRVYIRLGCHYRTLEDWGSDFWNNPNEFPNDGSVKSELRLNAFNFLKRWAELKIKETT